MRTLFVLMAMLFSGASPCQAELDFSFTVIPDTPLADEPFQILVTRAASECSEPLPGMIGTTEIGDDTIRYEIDVSDICQSLPAQEFTYDAAGLPAGQYVFDFSVCHGPVPPVEPRTCTTVDLQNITVLGDGSDRAAFHAIPAFGAAGVGLLACGIGLSGLMLMRRR